MTPLHELSPRSRFADRAAEYARHRPDYPAEAISAVLEMAGKKAGVVVADVGAGTGISSRMLASNAAVVALEPNAAMARAAGSHPHVQFVIAAAESIPLRENSADVVTCFQAFHWLEPDSSLAEFHRVLRPEGAVAVVWNKRDRQDAFTNAYSDLVEEFAEGHPAEERAGAVDPLYSSPLFHKPALLSFPHGQDLTDDQLVGRARSTSYLPSSGPRHEAMIRRILALHASWRGDGGRVRLVYRCEVHCARPRLL